jgi:hypothetical protein
MNPVGFCCINAKHSNYSVFYNKIRLLDCILIIQLVSTTELGGKT